MEEIAKGIAVHYQIYLVISCLALLVGVRMKPREEEPEILKYILLGLLRSYLLIGGTIAGLLGMMGFFAQVVKYAIK
jgi:hypothetical protein